MIACNDAVQIPEYNEIEDLHKLKAEFVNMYHKLYLKMWMYKFHLSLLRYKWINKYR